MAGYFTKPAPRRLISKLSVCSVLVPCFLAILWSRMQLIFPPGVEASLFLVNKYPLILCDSLYQVPLFTALVVSKSFEYCGILTVLPNMKLTYMFYICHGSNSVISSSPFQYGACFVLDKDTFHQRWN